MSEMDDKQKVVAAGWTIDRLNKEIEQLQAENEKLKEVMQEQLNDKTAYKWMACDIINRFRQALKGAVK